MTTAERLRARAAARKAQGKNQVYPQHSKPTSPKSRFRLPCVHLGEKIPGEPCGSTLTKCNKFGDITARFAPCKGAQRCCRDCPEYSRD